MDYLPAYLGHLASERRLSPHTRSNYARDIAALLGLCSETPLQSLSPQQVRRFIARFHSAGLGGKSLARRLSAWRGFFDYLVRDHGFSQNPCIGLRPPKSPKTLPHALSPDEASRLMGISSDGALDVRDKAILELFYSSGLRLAELAGLGLADVDFDEAVVRVVGKGNKTRVVPVGQFALAALHAWLPLRLGLAAADEQALFSGRTGHRLGHRPIQYRLKQWGIKLGLNAKVHPHVLRHSFASHVLQSSSDLRAVQEMLGHASISTTQVYTHLDFQHLAKTYDAAHPRAKKKP